MAQPKVRELDDAVRVDHYVIGLDIAVYYAKFILDIVERDCYRFAYQEAVGFAEVLFPDE